MSLSAKILGVLLFQDLEWQETAESRKRHGAVVGPQSEAACWMLCVGPDWEAEMERGSQ